MPSKLFIMPAKLLVPNVPLGLHQPNLGPFLVAPASPPYTGKLGSSKARVERVEQAPQTEKADMEEAEENKGEKTEGYIQSESLQTSPG